MNKTIVNRAKRIAGVLLGTAVGDAVGLAREGLSRRRAARIYGSAPLEHRFLLNRGMVSDDTEHTCMVAQALLDAPDDQRAFARSLAKRFRYWLLGIPAGIGKATLRGIVKLWLGFSPAKSGVYSAGNGPAMRSAIIGVCLGGDEQKMITRVQASTRITHSDPKAEYGALAVAQAAHFASSREANNICFREAMEALRQMPMDQQWDDLLKQIETHLEAEASAVEFSEHLGQSKGVSGYVYHTVPVALFCWLRYSGDFRRSVEEVIQLGGDTDTSAAIVGALAGATIGVSGIPKHWVSGILEWPRSVRWMKKLAARLAQQYCESNEHEKVGACPLFWPGIPLRNLLFLVIVLGHVLRRLLPPY